MMKKIVHWYIPTACLVGLVFCVLSGAGVTDSWCLTQGCRAYKGYEVAGVSPYWLGALAFLIIFCLSVIPRGKNYLIPAAGVFLLGDIVFLSIQLALWPCVNCLVAAGLIGSVALALAGKNTTMRIITACWALLLFSNAVTAGKELIPPWPIYGQDEAPVKVFFSPTCPSCRGMLNDLFHRPGWQKHLALYPIAKDAEDTRLITLLTAKLTHGLSVTEAFAQSQPDKETDITEINTWTMFFNLWRNKVALSRLGVTTVPALISKISLGAEQIPASAAGCSAVSKENDKTCEKKENNQEKTNKILKDIFR